MSTRFEKPVIAFIWRSEEITSSVIEMTRRTKTRAIFDLSSIDPETAGAALLQADASGNVAHLKVSAESLSNPGLEDFLEETDIDTIWTEVHPISTGPRPERHLDRIGELSARFTVIPIVGDYELINLILDRYPTIGTVALKGTEAAGFVSTETAFTLYASVREMIRARAGGPGLAIWGGVASPEAAAAFLSAGAEGIVFESLHWLTDLVAADDATLKRIWAIRPDHTDLVGLNLSVPCRLFNKGNSTAVKELKSFAGSLCGDEIGDEQRVYFADKIRNEAVPPLSGRFGRDELIPLGVEAAFADSFVRRFGLDTEIAVDAFVSEIERLCAESGGRLHAFANSSAAREMGTRYPFIQGAMSWITDVPEFALRVAQAGGLPTVALGLMDGKTIGERIGRLPELMGDRPYAVNVITLAENPHRDEQLAWIKQTRPRFAVIAAGEPSHAAELLADGIDVIYIAPNEELLRMAVEAGVRYVICEGNEAGGHVGEHSTLTLAQMVHDLKLREPSILEGVKIVLAGGIFNRETAFMAAMLGADALQMGTAYLATTDIVETGALSALYRRMIVESVPGSTVVTGEGTGLRVRSLKTPRIEAVCSLERDFAAGSEDEGSFRLKMETLSAGSLFIAARGQDKPGGVPLDDSRCVQEGQFMSGACSGAVRGQRPVKDLHTELAEASLEEGLPFTGPIREQYAPRPAGVDRSEGAPRWAGGPASRPSRSEQARERIAITGMAVVNSLGNSPEDVWDASLAGNSGIIEVPVSRWNHEIYYHPRPRMPEKTYCRVAAFQNIEISRKDLGIPPQDFRTMTTATRATMWLAKHALERSGILDSDIPRERIAVLISQNSGEAAATLEDTIIRGCADRIAASLKSALNLSPDAEKTAAEEIKAGRIVIDDTTLLGRLNCSAGGFICNKYGFMGPSFSVSAACATALVALYSAYQMIRNGIIDAAVVGGAEEYLTPMHFLEFSALGALAGLSGVQRRPDSYSRPFDRERDGMVLGEGGGMIVIERESIARERGARVHAYISSMGASNNHLGMVESSRLTQEIAIRSSFRDASYGPEAVDLVECHATSTRQGDVEEVLALKTFFNGDRRTRLTSFKSQIGHTLGASGINSLIRGIMAAKAGLFPPNLNYDSPDEEMSVEGSGLLINAEPDDWRSHNGDPRRFQVNAFGFGGSNYVVQVEQALEDEDTVLVLPEPSADRDTGECTTGEIPGGLFFFAGDLGSEPYRIAVIAESESEARKVLEKCELSGNGGTIGSKRIRTLARQNVYLGRRQEAAPLAFVFPGQGSHYAGMGHELYDTFPVVREWMDRAASVAEFDLLHLLFHDREEDLQKTRWQQPALFTMEFAMVQYLLSLGIRPAALAGHSLGELTALCLAGVFSFEDGFRIVNKRALCMDKACELNVDPGVMLACDAPLDVLKEMIASREQIYVTNINSPHQVVLGGNTEGVTELGNELKAMGHRSTLLRVSMAFHSPIMRCIHDELEAFIAEIDFHPPRIPVISNTTMKPFPDDVTEIKRIVMAHLESPVHWMQNVGTLHADCGVRVFVEVGPREILSNLIADTLDDVQCIQTSLPSAEVTTFKTALAQLYANGHLQVARVSTFPSPAGARGTAAATASVARDIPREHGSRDLNVPAATALGRIVHREIAAFVMESFGRFLRPNVMAAVRREYDPNFADSDLDDLLKEMFPGSTPLTPFAGEQVPYSPVPSPEVFAAPVVEPETRMDESVPESEPGTMDVTEEVIRIIMDATGYDREEIEPDMDLREDLSIRSSRLPVIMDSLEGHFNMKIELEDFMDVRTIRDIAVRISEILGKNADAPALPKAQVSVDRSDAGPSASPDEKALTIKRILFHEVPQVEQTVQPVEIAPLESVAIMSATGGTGLRKTIGGVFRRDYGATIVPLSILDDPGGEEEAYDLRVERDQALVAEKLGGMEGLAGMVFIVDDLLEKKLERPDSVAGMLKGFFRLLKSFADSPSKRFVLVVRTTEDDHGAAGVLSEGLLGMLLSAAHEFSSVQFRSLRLDDRTDLSEAIRAALNRGRKPIETICREGEFFTLAGRAVPDRSESSVAFELHPSDVVVFSGGAYGITPYIADALVPFGCTMVFLGRTVVDTDIEFANLPLGQDSLNAAVERLTAERKPHLNGTDREREISRVLTSAQIFRTVQNLRDRGIDAEYVSCDVTDTDAIKAVVAQILARHGKIDGIVHSAGVLRDKFVKQLTPDEFAQVVDVKLVGAWNLFNSTRESGLRFITCLSSAASIQGNPGQVNYAAANRSMSELMNHVRRNHPDIRCKALILPPIEGAGMAEDPEIRALMSRMKAAYVRAEELAQLFCHELMTAPADDVWVMFMRSLPDVPTALIDASEPEPESGTLPVGTLSFRREDFPMVDSIRRVDLAQGELEATRIFSQERDLWIADHKPFQFLKHPLVSAIMALETFMEVSRLLYPHLCVQGVRDAEFIEIISCPPGASREASVQCRRIHRQEKEVVCRVTLAGKEMSPSGRILDRMSDNYRAEVILGGHRGVDLEEVAGFPVRLDEMDTRAMTRAEVLDKYEKRTTMLGRYRVIETLDGTGPGCIRGRMTYRVENDFSDLEETHYQYSPYLLEALMQLANFFILMRDDPEGDRTVIPHKIGEVRFAGQCLAGDTVIVEGRVGDRNDDGLIWHACARDTRGRLLMTARDIRMRRFAK
ncbi:MAG: SDR family NAD(P)-dependent oxidoreductase [Desulfomonilaceae bacterium]|nr:SDR family NAD(P)-dependent oxidoreductase [Desulfomonilaceae bacterium]